MRPLAKFRKDHGVTQRAMAAHFNCAPSTVSRYERGAVKRPQLGHISPISMREAIAAIVERRGDHIQMDLEDFTGAAQ